MISVIVPVYNAEKFLDKCINSILSQTYKDYELILVNDGSSDKSGEICDSFSAQYPNVHTIHQSNSGVSAARNNGMAAAKGEYIAFVDSDDSVCENYLELLFKNINGCDLAIGTTQMDLVKENRSVLLKVADKKYTLPQFKKDMRGTFKGQYINSPVNKLFVSRIIRNNNLAFDPSMNLGEDCIFVLSYLDKCQHIRCFSDIIYHYNVHTSYVRSESYKQTRFYDRIKMCGVQKEFYRQDTQYYYKRILSEYLYTAYYETLDNKNIPDEKQFIKNFIAENQLDYFIKKSKINIFDKKVFFKLACEMLHKADVEI